jgi:hypothetical protein
MMSDERFSELRSGAMAVDERNGAVVEVICDLKNGTVAVRNKGSKRARHVPRAHLSETNEKPRR